jgi:hypothetical protein
VRHTDLTEPHQGLPVHRRCSDLLVASRHYPSDGLWPVRGDHKSLRASGESPGRYDCSGNVPESRKDGSYAGSSGEDSGKGIWRS